MAPTCDDCGRRIHSPEGGKCCPESHDWTGEYESVEVHVSCPCPDHGWDADFRFPQDH